MTEFPQDIAPRPEKAPRKPRKLTKKEASEFMDALRLEHTTTPETDPDEALKRIDRVVKYIDLSRDPIVTKARQEMLRRAGYNPDEWKSYMSVMQPKDRNKGFTDEDMQKQFGRYPKALEFIVIQGEPYLYYQEHQPNPGMRSGIANHFWIGFVRHKPDVPQIDKT